MKLLIVDDHGVMRDGLAALFRQAWPEAVIVEARDATEGLAIASAQPDLDAVVLDLRLPGMDGMAAIAEFCRRRSGLQVLVLSVSEDAGEVRRAIASGARGYVPKSASAQTLLSALRFMLDGNVYVPPLLVDAADVSPDPVRSRQGADPRWRLTPRQIDVLALLADGRSNKEIARTLGLHDQTVKTHITAIFKALDVVNRTQAAGIARRAGLIPRGDQVPPPNSAKQPP